VVAAYEDCNLVQALRLVQAGQEQRLSAQQVLSKRHRGQQDGVDLQGRKFDKEDDQSGVEHTAVVNN